MRIEKVSAGGFIVSDLARMPGDYSGAIYACSTLEEALQFIRENILDNGQETS